MSNQTFKRHYLIGFLIVLFFAVVGVRDAHGYFQGGYYSEAAYYSEASYYSEGTYQTNFSTDVNMRATLDITGTISKGSGSFVIDHPLDPANKLLYHSFVESPDVKNIYDGVVKLDEKGEAAVELPGYFESLNSDFRYQYTAISVAAPNLHIKEEITNNTFIIAGGPPNARVSWQVTGIRQDPYILANPIVTEVEKGPEELVDRGEYVWLDYPTYADKSQLEIVAENFWSRLTTRLGRLWSWFVGQF